MIVCREEIYKKYKAGLRVAGIGPFPQSQFLAIAKCIVSEQTQKPVSEMMAIEMLNGDIAVRGKPFKSKENDA